MKPIDDYLDAIEDKLTCSLSKLEKIQAWGILYELRQETVDVVMEIAGKIAEEKYEKEKNEKTKE